MEGEGEQQAEAASDRDEDLCRHENVWELQAIMCRTLANPCRTGIRCSSG
jgi:hypothetical protein